LRDHNAALDDRSAALDDHSAALDDYNAALDDHNAALDDRSAALDDYNAALDDHNAALDDRSAALDDHNAALRDRSAALDDRSAALRDHSAALRDRSAADGTGFFPPPTNQQPMPAPLTWDTSGLTWDSGATWDGAAVSPPQTKSMNLIKARIDFSRSTAAALGPIAQNIHDQMTTNAATFPTPPVTMAALQTQISAYDAKLVARASRASAEVLAFRIAREALEVTLGVLGNHVNSVAKGDPTIVEQSGFPSYPTGRTPSSGAPAAPTDLRLSQGDLNGSLIARYKPARPRTTNEVQTTIADPNLEANWQTKGIFTGSKAELSGFTPGVVVWVRVRTVGRKGVMGAWSDPAQIRVL
jgi:hypothetical protein